MKEAARRKLLYFSYPEVAGTVHWIAKYQRGVFRL